MMSVDAVGPRRAVSRPASRAGLASVRAWLYALAVLVALMVAIGGATRLTGSGLSITEWRPVTGAVPPLSDASWAAEFQRYRASSQYQNLNEGMSLGEFKSIYWWEWSHRQLGRLIGLAFFLPLVVFWLRGAVTPRLAATLLGIGVLGGMQGAIGWIMVASGLQPGMVAVAPIKLSLHLTVASVILALIVSVAAGLRDEAEPERESSPPGLRRTSYLLVGLVLLQIALGGLVAGSHAGFTYNTWPLMDGRLVPGAGDLLARVPWYENFVDNPLLVQFDHRALAYALVLLAVFHAWSARRAAPGSPFARRATGVAAVALSQVALGIVTLLLVVPLWAGLAHQLLAMALLAMATAHARLSAATAARTRPEPSAAHALA